MEPNINDQQKTQKDTSIRYPEPVLCYVDDHKAWFTTLDLMVMSKLCEWNLNKYGDDDAYLPYSWDDYEEMLKENGEDDQYNLSPFETIAIYFEGDWWSQYLKSLDITIQWINGGVVAWLFRNSSNRTKKYMPIYAGTPICEFIKQMEESGGQVFLTSEQHQKYYPAK